MVDLMRAKQKKEKKTTDVKNGKFATSDAVNMVFLKKYMRTKYSEKNTLFCVASLCEVLVKQHKKKDNQKQMKLPVISV